MGHQGLILTVQMCLVLVKWGFCCPETVMAPLVVLISGMVPVKQRRTNLWIFFSFSLEIS